ncbi:MAG: hypothetical protein DHS20C14_11280 [Phycisphaeraceae bacterium]|nr:MAG: hypothetical protein DHS20C14_11280 [Phycisphaeraceae bacterium]
MTTAAFILIVLGLFMGALTLYQGYRGTVDILSVRNLFLLSFAVFQITSALFAIITQEWHEYPLTTPTKTVWVFTMSSVVFMAVFLIVYQWGPIAKSLARRVPGEDASPSTGSLLILAGVILGGGIVFKTMLVYVPVFGPLSDLIGGGLIALAAGLATWAWAPRLFNPVVAAYAGGIIAVALATSLVGVYGRRDLLAVVGSSAWGLYHAWWKHGGFGYSMKRFAVAGGAGLLLVAGYTSVRNHRLTEAGVGEIVRALAGADYRAGLMDLAHGQYAANISMWIIDTRPEGYDYDTLHSLRFGSTAIIPRTHYPPVLGEKPVGLGLMIPQQIQLRGKTKGFNVGPGMIGHIYNDNPWLALWLYPAIFALGIRFIDEAVRSRYYSPFIILPVGAGLGELAGLARGEIGLFAFNATMGILSAYGAMVVIRFVLSQFGWRPVYDEGPDWFDEHNPWGGDEGEHPEAYADEYGDADSDSDADVRAA